MNPLHAPGASSATARTLGSLAGDDPSVTAEMLSVGTPLMRTAMRLAQGAPVTRPSAAGPLDAMPPSPFQEWEPGQEARLDALIATLPKQRRVALLIGGPSAAGKSSLVKTVRRLARERRVVDFPGDMFYRDADDPELPFTPCGRPYWDDPQALHFDEMADAIATLIVDGRVEIPRYDFGAVRPGGWNREDVSSLGCRMDGSTAVEMGADDILVVDSLHATNPSLLSKLSLLGLPHLSVFLDSLRAEDRLVRRIVRDYHERGRSPERTLADWDATTSPGEMCFVRPTLDQLEPGSYLYLVNQLPRDPGLSRAAIERKVSALRQHGLAPSYEAFATPDEDLGRLAELERARLEGLITAPSTPAAERKAAASALERLTRATYLKEEATP